MSISDVLRGKGHHVVKVRTTDTVTGRGAEIVRGAHRRGRRRGPVDASRRHFFGTRFRQCRGRTWCAGAEFSAEKLMSAPVVTCRSSDRVETAMAAMTMAKIRHLPVVDNGQLVGIVSIGDLVKYRLDEKALEANVLLDIARLHA